MTTPTAVHAATVSCHKCKAEMKGTIDEIRAAGWSWYSDASARYFWCGECMKKHADEFMKKRAEARASHEAANVDPRREEKLAERRASDG